MKNHVFFLGCFIALLSPTIVFSQNSFISIGGEIGKPNSFGLNMVAGTLTGGSLRIESSFGKHTNGLVTIGYLFSPKQNPYPTTTPTTTSTYKVLPLQIGMKYYVKEKEVFQKGFFISGELGLLFTRTHFTFESNPDIKTKETDLGLAPGIGYIIGNIEPSFRLQYDLTDAGFKVYYYNFRVAYAFMNKKKMRS